VRDQSLGELLDGVAARTAAPGGGTAAASACALAAALAEMAARFAPDGMAAEAARAAELREQSLELAERELRAYEPVLEALRSSPDDPGREDRLRAARSRAADPPLALARVAAELAELAVSVSRRGNPRVRGDAITAVLLAEAACGAAATLVRINLSGQPEDVRRYEAYDLGRRALSAREEVRLPG
jgi:formiminotetrahydrofolate cyclodeaminase